MTHPAIKSLVMLRTLARKHIQMRERYRAALQKARIIKANAIATGDRATTAQAQFKIENKFALIEVGRAFVHVAAECEKLPRGDWLRALNVNESEWFTPAMLRDGDRLHEVVMGLRLENSATPDTGDISRPLAACLFMAMVNRLNTDLAFGKFVHDQCDKELGGKFTERFGEWQEPTVLQRLGVSV